MKKTFWWFLVAGVLNGLLLWIRERMKEEREGGGTCS
jgi:hypothetical protein